MAKGFINIAGITLPYPDYENGLQTIRTTVVGGKNVNGVFIGQRVNRDESDVVLIWNYLDAQLWAEVLQIFEQNFINDVEYYDMVSGEFITRKMYVSDRSAKPCSINPLTGKWMMAQNCSLTLTDTGG